MILTPMFPLLERWGYSKANVVRWIVESFWKGTFHLIFNSRRTTKIASTGSSDDGPARYFATARLGGRRLKRSRLEILQSLPARSFRKLLIDFATEASRGQHKTLWCFDATRLIKDIRGSCPATFSAGLTAVFYNRSPQPVISEDQASDSFAAESLGRWRSWLSDCGFLHPGQK